MDAQAGTGQGLCLVITASARQLHQCYALALQRQRQLLHRLPHAFQLGQCLALLQLRDIAHTHLVGEQTHRVLARLHRVLGHGQLGLQRAQSDIGLRHGRGHRQAYRVAIRLAGLQALIGGPAQTAQAIPEIQLPARLQHGLSRTHMHHLAGSCAQAAVGRARCAE